MLSRIITKTLDFFFGTPPTTQRYKPVDTADIPEPQKLRDLSEWEKFLLAAVQYHAGATDREVSVTYSFVRELARSVEAPFTSSAKILEGFESLENQGIISRRKEGAKVMTQLHQTVSRPHEFLGMSDREWRNRSAS